MGSTPLYKADMIMSLISPRPHASLPAPQPVSPRQPATTCSGRSCHAPSGWTTCIMAIVVIASTRSQQRIPDACKYNAKPPNAPPQKGVTECIVSLVIPNPLSCHHPSTSTKNCCGAPVAAASATLMRSAAWAPAGVAGWKVWPGHPLAARLRALQSHPQFSLALNQLQGLLPAISLPLLPLRLLPLPLLLVPVVRLLHP